MFSILRPFLFSLDPETAHDLAIKSLKFNYLPKKIFDVEDEQILNIELMVVLWIIDLTAKNIKIF